MDISGTKGSKSATILPLTKNAAKNRQSEGDQDGFGLFDFSITDDLLAANKIRRMERLVEAVALDRIKLAAISGEQGTGKTVRVKAVLNRLGVRYVCIDGFVSAPELYKTLFLHQTDIVVFDDSDNVFKNPVSLQLLNHATSDLPKRVLTYRTREGFDDEVPEEFEFRGRTILLTNHPFDSASMSPYLRAFIDRGLTYRIELSFSEKLDFIEKRILNREFEGTTLEERRDAFGLFCQAVLVSPGSFSLRGFRNALSLYVTDKDTFADSLEMLFTPDPEVEVLADIVNREHEFKTAKDQVAEFVKKTGGSQATYYRRKKEYADHLAFVRSRVLLKDHGVPAPAARVGTVAAAVTDEPEAFTLKERLAIAKVPVIVSYSGGVDSTALLIALKQEGIDVDLILFADTLGEKPHTYKFIETFNGWLVRNGMPEITIVKKTNRDGDVVGLEEDCLRKNVLPGVVYGVGDASCSQKYKTAPQEKYINHWQPAIATWKDGMKPIILIGYNAGEGRRASKVPKNDKFHYHYPLVEWGMTKEDCRKLIESAGLRVPQKSACWFCPNSKKDEILDLQRRYPDLMERALKMESNADLTSIKGLGRSFSWREFIDGNADACRVAEVSDVDLPCGCYDGGDDEIVYDCDQALQVLKEFVKREDVCETKYSRLRSDVRVWFEANREQWMPAVKLDAICEPCRQRAGEGA